MAPITFDSGTYLLQQVRSNLQCGTQPNMEVGFMVFNATFDNISVISWQSVLLVEETGVPGENHRLLASH
jgi:hypothetical protein